MQRTEIKTLYTSNPGEGKLTVCGWVRTIRSSKALG